MKPSSPKPRVTSSDSDEKEKEVAMSSRRRSIKKKHKKRSHKSDEMQKATKRFRTEEDRHEALISNVTNVHFISRDLKEAVELLREDIEQPPEKKLSSGMWAAERLHQAISQVVQKCKPILAELDELKKIESVQQQVGQLTDDDDDDVNTGMSQSPLPMPAPKATATQKEGLSDDGQALGFVNTLGNMFSIFAKPPECQSDTAGTEDNPINIDLDQGEDQTLPIDQDLDPAIEHVHDQALNETLSNMELELVENPILPNPIPKEEVANSNAEKVDEVVTLEDEENDNNSTEHPHSDTTEELELKPKAEKRKRSAAVVAQRKDRLSRSNDFEYINSWVWNGNSIDKRDGKEFFNGITRGEQVVSVGDSAQFTSVNPKRPYFGFIKELYEEDGKKKVSLTWYYRPNDVTAKKKDTPPIEFRGFALFKSNHFDVNDIRTVEKRCVVLDAAEFRAEYGSKFASGRKSKTSKRTSTVGLPKDTYYVAGFWNAHTIKFESLPDSSDSDDGEAD